MESSSHAMLRRTSGDTSHRPAGWALAPHIQQGITGRRDCSLICDANEFTGKPYVNVANSNINVALWQQKNPSPPPASKRIGRCPPPDLRTLDYGETSSSPELAPSGHVTLVTWLCAAGSRTQLPPGFFTSPAVLASLVMKIR